MSDQITLPAESRTEFGKGAARRARAAGQIPAVLYGHGEKPLHILLPGHETGMALKHANVLLSIKLAKEAKLAVVKDIQRDPVRQIIEHIDLLIVRQGERIAIDVPIRLLGESISGTIHMLEHATLHVAAEATHLPDAVEVSIEGLLDGDRIHARDVALPEGVELLTDPDALVVAVMRPKKDEEAAVEVAAAPATAESGAEATSAAAE